MPFTITSPAGLSTDSSTQEKIYYTGPDGKLYEAGITSVLTPQQREQANKQAGSANGALELAKQVLRTQYGIDVSTLPKQNPADMEMLAKKINGVGSNGMPQMFNLDLSKALTLPASGPGVSYTFNTDPALKGYANPNSVNPQTGAYQPTSNTPSQPGTPNSAPQAPGASTGTSSAPQSQLTDQQFNDWLGKQNLSQQEKDALRAIYGALGTHDEQTATRLAAAMEAAKQYSDPYFKGQLTLAIDALKRGVASKENDLAYQEQVASNTLADLRANTTASKDYLTFQNQQQLADISRRKEQELQTLQEDLAARGLTSSSIRTGKENILRDTYEGLTETANRSLLNQTGTLDRQLSSGGRDYALNTARLQQLAASGKTDLLRSAEEQIGSSNLANAGYSTLGGIGGILPANQAKDQLSFASSFVF